MKSDLEKAKAVSVSDFKAHCTEHLRSVERTGTSLEVTRHGKVVAIVSPPQAESQNLADWVGSGAGLMVEGAADLFNEPTWKEGDWEMQRDEHADEADR